MATTATVAPTAAAVLSLPPPPLIGALVAVAAVKVLSVDVVVVDEIVGMVVGMITWKKKRQNI